MKLFIKLSAVLLLPLACLSALGYLYWYSPKFKNKAAQKYFAVNKNTATQNGLQKLQQQAAGIGGYIKKNHFNNEYCFMIDMSQPSGRQRFYVYNIKKDSIEMAGLVTHGAGSVTGTGKLFFSNEPNCNCTSLGKYKIGNAYQGRFGLAYKLYGLSKTNSKAFERFVVLHAHSCVPAGEVYPLSICPSLGCPTVSPAFLQKLKVYIEASEKPVLLNIFY